MCQIEFHQAEATRGKIPAPYPAGRSIPEWFKLMPPDNEQYATMKRCAPFLEAMTAGYIIPAPSDLRIVMSESGLAGAFGTWKFLGLHHAEEYAGAPIPGKLLVKFYNPWIIVTPPEYVCLFTAPMNRFEMPFAAVTGIVETSTYYKQVAQPMVCMMRPGDTFELRCGAPMIQVIPFRREEWTSRTALLDSARLEQQQAKLNANPRTYKEELWKKMHFS